MWTHRILFFALLLMIPIGGAISELLAAVGWRWVALFMPVWSALIWAVAYAWNRTDPMWPKEDSQ